MFEYTTFIRMCDVDAAGVLFFPNQFRIVEEAYEVFLESVGKPLGKIIAQDVYGLPVVHAETNYRAPLRLGDRIILKLSLSHQGTTSFTLSHEIYKADGVLVGSGHTIHVCLDRQTGQKIPLPEEWNEILQKI